MKIGSVAWGWTPTPEDMPVGDSLEVIAKNVKALGFDFVDYLVTYESLDEYFTEAATARIRQTVEGLGLTVGGVAFQADWWNVPDTAVTEKQFAYLDKCLKTAKGLGATSISAIIPQPYGSKNNRRPSPSDKVASNLPADFCWEKEWACYSANMKRAAKAAADYGLNVALECFPKSLCSTPDAMLNLLAAVDEPNFGIQLDTAHLMNQSIDIETAIFMLGGKRIFHIHCKDSDGLTRGNLAPGTGIIDYPAVFRALKNVGYEGNMSVEVEFSTNPAAYMKLGLEHVKASLALV